MVPHLSTRIKFLLIGVFVFASAVSAPRAFASSILKTWSFSGITVNFNDDGSISGTGGTVVNTCTTDTTLFGPSGLNGDYTVSPVFSNIFTYFSNRGVTYPVSLPGAKISFQASGSGCGTLTTDFYDLGTLQLDSPSTGSFNGSAAPVVDTSTHFISLVPPNASTTATTTDLGANIYALDTDFPQPGRLHISAVQDGAFACENSGAVIDAIQNCAGPNAPQSPFTIDFDGTLEQLIAGVYNLSTSTTFTGGGKWNIEYDIQESSRPWYFLGLIQTFTTIVSTTTQITVGQPSPIDIVRSAIASSTARVTGITNAGIGAILASTTATLGGACIPVSFSFNVGDCLTLLIYPGDQAISDDFTIIKELPPWGYVFRLIDIINMPVASSSLPTIDYTFATSSPMSVIGHISFDPFTSIQQSSDLINQMVSDRATPETVWQIFQPVVQIFVYLVLFSMILHDLTGIYNHDRHNRKEK